MCGSGPSFGSPSSSPAGTNTRSIPSGRSARLEPQREQNGRKLPGDELVAADPLGAAQPAERARLRAASKLTNAAPCALRHIEQ